MLRNDLELGVFLNHLVFQERLREALGMGHTAWRAAWENVAECGCSDDTLRQHIGAAFEHSQWSSGDGWNVWGGPRPHLRVVLPPATPETGMHVEGTLLVDLVRALLQIPYPVQPADYAEEFVSSAPPIPDPYRRPFIVKHQVSGEQKAQGQSRFYGLENALYYCAALQVRIRYAEGGRLELWGDPPPDAEEGAPPRLVAQGSPTGLTVFFAKGSRYSIALHWAPTLETAEAHQVAAVAADEQEQAVLRARRTMRADTRR